MVCYYRFDLCTEGTLLFGALIVCRLGLVVLLYDCFGGGFAGMVWVVYATFAFDCVALGMLL